MDKFELKRTVQCKKCPWKVDTNPNEIPNGYCTTKHKNLKDTIAEPSDPIFKKEIKIMACHESKNESMQHCIGWLHNQLGFGNNIALRINMMSCSNISQIKIIGQQHKNFNDTIK